MAGIEVATGEHCKEKTPQGSPSKSSELLKSKTEKLFAIGLWHNPCQGCDAYYAIPATGGCCAVEADGGCEWIRLHDAALAV
jgi:hypothetical protein